MTDRTVDQSGANAGGDVVAGDKVTTVVPPAHPSPMAALLEQLQEERKSDDAFDRRIAELQHYYESVDSGELVGLEGKLTRGGRDDLIPCAIREKELFAKRLAKHQLWESAQEIYAYMLGRVRDRFEKEIKPLLARGALDSDVDAAIVREVIEPSVDELQANELGINTAHLRGMVYFLTGNCFLRWDRQSNAQVSPGT